METTEWKKNRSWQKLKTFRVEWKCTCNIPKLMGHNEGDFKRHVHSLIAYIKNWRDFILVISQYARKLRTWRKNHGKGVDREKSSNSGLQSIKQNQPDKQIQRVNQTKSWFLEKINKIDKLLAKLTKRFREI